MRKVFLDDLPKKYGFGANKDKLVIDWKKSIGYKVKFIYNDIEDEFEIIGYDHKVNIVYKNNIYKVFQNDN